jgi:hypothetical protein
LAGQILHALTVVGCLDDVIKIEHNSSFHR